MLFNSLAFAIFLPVVYVLYWALGPRRIRAQNGLLLIASYVFYGWWDWRFLGLIVLSSLVDYLVGLRLDRTPAGRTRRALLGVSLAANLGVLGLFKYFDFFIASAGEVLQAFGMEANLPSLRVILPVGISFYTFQTLRYTIDVYRRRVAPTHDPVAFFAFVSFFPQLVAGPIERARHLLPQFQRPRRFDAAAARDGLRQMLWGFFKKVVVADNLAGTVDRIFAHYADLGSAHLLVGVFFFAIQIYADFSGYSDIAIGTARLFGFDLMRNFATPYFSRNIGEFWQRWHISLSTWFRDYVYIPLGGNRVGPWRHLGNVLVTFTLSGLWHGANWTFLIWGFLHGLYYVPLMLLGRHKAPDAAPAAERLLPRPGEACAMLATFLAVLVAWVFFRAESVGQAIGYLARLTGGDWSTSGLAGYRTHLAFVGVLLVVEWLQRARPHGLDVARWPWVARRGAYYAVAALIVLKGNTGYVPFIYFQF